MYFNSQNVQLNHRLWTIRAAFLPRFKQTFAFQPFRLFRYSFRNNSNSVCSCFRLPVYKWSPVYPALARILHQQMARLKRLNNGLLILSDLELLALPYVAPITAISRLSEYRLYYMHDIVQQFCGKVICHSQKYTREHQVKPFEFMQSFYTALQIVRHSFLRILLTLDPTIINDLW